ncbi:hypothetical protein BDP27DRAFT_1201113, partial [Rhodocollybia butyracea]
VVGDSISKLLFARSHFARLPAFLKGLFLFSFTASFDTFRYKSCIGNSILYTTTLRGM